MWSAGISLFKMLTGVTPFESNYHHETIKNICKGYDSKEHQEKINSFSEEVQDLIEKLLKPKENRLSAAEALNHPWFNKLT